MAGREDASVWRVRGGSGVHCADTRRVKVRVGCYMVPHIYLVQYDAVHDAVRKGGGRSVGTGCQHASGHSLQRVHVLACSGLRVHVATCGGQTAHEPVCCGQYRERDEQ